MLKGIIKFWNEERGFGFIEVGEFSHDYDLFFHISSCAEEYSPTRGDIFMLVKDRNERGYFAKKIIQTGERVNVAEYFDNRVSLIMYNKARKTRLAYERGCTCQEDRERWECNIENSGYEYMPYGGKCWYCNEMSD